MKWNDPDRQAFIRYVEKEQDINQIRVLLDLPYDACAELYKMMMDECRAWVEVTTISFDNLWEIAREHYRIMMAKGIWQYKDWKKFVEDTVYFLQFRQIVLDFDWENIKEIAWA